MKILFLISSLRTGGAERQLVVLARLLAIRGHQVSIALMYGGGELEEEARSAGIEIHQLRKRSTADVIPFLFNLSALIRRIGPDILHGYLEMANLSASLARLIAPGPRVVWGIRNADMQHANWDWRHRLVYQLSTWLVLTADRIIVNSRAGLQYHVNRGFPPDRMAHIPNGIDTDRFQPDSSVRAARRKEWGITLDQPVIGFVGRFDPIKDLPGFLKAVARLEAPGLRVVCIIAGDEAQRAAVRTLAGELGLSEALLLPEASQALETVYPAFDLFCSTSLGEGFSNVVCEAMASAVSCVVTDVGDSAYIVGDTGRAVRPSSPEALAVALDEALGTDRRALRQMGEAARRRIVTEFSLDRLADRSEAAQESLQPR